jgi:hypothetical protein
MTALDVCAPGRFKPVLSFDQTDRAPKNILEHCCPVNILLGAHSRDDPAKVLESGDPLVTTTWIKWCDTTRRPSPIVEMLGASAVIHAHRPLRKPIGNVFRSPGYSQRSFHAADTALGGHLEGLSSRILMMHDYQLTLLAFTVMGVWEQV